MSAVKRQTSRSLTTTLAIAFFTLSAVVLSVSSGLQLFSNIQTQQAAISSEQQRIAQDASKTVSSFIEEQFSILETAINLSNPVEAPVQEREITLESLLGLQPSYRQLVLLNANDYTLAEASRFSQTSSGQIIAQLTEDALAETHKNQRYISPIYIDDSTGEPLVTLAIPTKDVFGDFQGTLAVELNLKFMWDLVDQLQVGKTGTVFVVDRQGNLIAYSDTSRVLRGENVVHLERVGEFVSKGYIAEDQPQAGVSQGINGGTVVTTYAPLGTPDWAVVTELPWQEAYQNVISQGIWSILITLCMAFLAGLIGAFAARRLAVPLTDLTETATRISEGNIELEATTRGPNETVQLANAFNSMTAQLRGFISGLEERVTERTAELETANQQVARRAKQFEAIAQISRIISSIQDPEELLSLITRMISQQFGFYHVGIFMLDENKRYAVLRAVNSEGGERMLARHHRLEIGQTGIVGHVTSTGNPRIALDVGSDAVFFDNPDLPETRSEVALPLKYGEVVIGALDIQSTEPNAFSNEDVAVFTVLADQLAIAIQNARSLEQARAAAAEAEAISRQLVGRAWSDIKGFTPVVGYRFDGSKPEPLTRHTNSGQAGGQEEAFSVPVQLRGESIGRLRIKPATNGHEWSEDEIAIIRATAERVALAAENARLILESQKNAAKEQVIGEISSKISATAEVERIMQVAVGELRRALGASEVVFKIEPND
jgi:GAF domain-containing protein/HAMP domain-containing protein